ncbi:hypothetical protein B0H16DRAFT_1472254 [Mycena metata]|uniref:Uncharacterized protein n=1 Tax=Mycena metata TaxID=1033252 RepID=A0AAD7HNK0_9AGAR|nr:hypothetical protein B0H16DRAFT_1472254 [Mycena metata]
MLGDTQAIYAMRPICGDVVKFKAMGHGLPSVSNNSIGHSRCVETVNIPLVEPRFADLMQVAYYSANEDSAKYTDGIPGPDFLLSGRADTSNPPILSALRRFWLLICRLRNPDPARARKISKVIRRLQHETKSLMLVLEGPEVEIAEEIPALGGNEKFSNLFRHLCGSHDAPKDIFLMYFRVMECHMGISIFPGEASHLVQRGSYPRKATKYDTVPLIWSRIIGSVG